MEAECRADGVVPMRFAIFACHVLKYCVCHGRVRPVRRGVAPVTQNPLSKPEDRMPQNATPSGNQRPDFPTSLVKMSLVPRLPRAIHLCRSSPNVPRLPSFFETATEQFMFCSRLATYSNPWSCHINLTVQKWSACGVPFTFRFRHVLRDTTASRHGGVHCRTSVSTSKSYPSM